MHTWIYGSGTVQFKVQQKYKENHGSLNAINGSFGQSRHPVAEESSITPLEEDSQACPDVGDGLPFHLPGVPCQG